MKEKISERGSCFLWYIVNIIVVADDQNLRDIACGNNDKTNPALKGWRYDVFGKHALNFRKGKSSIVYDSVEKKIVFEEK